jgi:hypothetical protein
MTGERRISLGTLLGCCFLAAAPGCFFQRTETGVAVYRPTPSLGSDSQTADRRNIPMPEEKAKASKTHSDEDKPELLPWRSRIKDQFLNSRFAQSRKSSDGSSRKGIGVSKEAPKPMATLPPTNATNPPASLVSTSAGAKDDDDEQEESTPPSSGPSPRRNRPDLVAE